MNKDGYAAPLDALVVINALNLGAGEGEAEGTSNDPLFDYFAGNTNQQLPLSRSQAPATLPAAGSALPLTDDDSYRTAARSDQTAQLLGDRNTGRRWEAAVDQLLQEDSGLFLDELTGDDCLP